MSSFFSEAVKADETEVLETLKGFVSKEGNGSFALVLSCLTVIAEQMGEEASPFDGPCDKQGENYLFLERKIRAVEIEATQLSL